ncbi:hypothetical protein Cali_57 [Mycobacterium phage Cali]|uniref:Uncharacterized protein n=6 Tax=Bixzunavirus TaxID=680114 RepID=A0A411CCM4_9CAUD|nr:gp57 [Mycobacterium phage Cali]YP_003347734.1 hypothetical protein ET08_51 [Mycobacterium phage ET08]YP_009597656.1 hypothetical protein FDH18_gp053 [Mycobacterium phage Lukilu]YP_010057465.1 hypothetical protein KHO60_gp057 [Mycobacterium phage CharlieB]YP_010057934.1 hypothetical protein KHO62_gp060 [Mycobacterium phage NoodleTree]ACU41584.1 hypothetical protein LRRHOOD_56 [Mycobacterium phage LRRHood]ATN87511.1 hypothetical protein SEA_BEANWATER_53 [Mycobacterium phage BeanWater]ATN900
MTATTTSPAVTINALQVAATAFGWHAQSARFDSYYEETSYGFVRGAEKVVVIVNGSDVVTHYSWTDSASDSWTVAGENSDVPPSHLALVRLSQVD